MQNTEENAQQDSIQGRFEKPSSGVNKNESNNKFGINYTSKIISILKEKLVPAFKRIALKLKDHISYKLNNMKQERQDRSAAAQSAKENLQDTIHNAIIFEAQRIVDSLDDKQIQEIKERGLKNSPTQVPTKKKNKTSGLVK